MKIGFDISQTGISKAGCGYLADSFIRHISMMDVKNQYWLYRTFGNFYWDLDFDKIELIQKNNLHEGAYHLTLEDAKSFWKQPVDSIETALGSMDLIHSNNYFCPEKKLAKTQFIYTLYDLSFMSHPQWTTEQNRVFCFDNVFNASLNADYIIAISEYSKQHFLKQFSYYPENKISVIYPASRYQYNELLEKPQKFLNAPELSSGKFWLKTGTIEPRKNHNALLHAYAKLKASAEHAVFPLVLAGGTGWMMHDFENLIMELNLKENVILLGYVNDHELQWLYQNCYCFLYPSLFEGFGLPVLEAMSCGAPVITSNTSSIPEITGDAAILVHPTDVNELFVAMKTCEKIDFPQLRKKAMERAKLFSWKESTQKVLAIYDKLSGPLRK